MNFFISKGLIIRSLLRMANKANVEALKVNAEQAQNLISHLKNEMKTLNEQYNVLKAQQLLEENEKLKKAVEAAKNRLITIEVQNGIKQVPLPNESSPPTVLKSSEPPQPKANETASPVESVAATPKVDKPKKRKKG